MILHHDRYQMQTLVGPYQIAHPDRAINEFYIFLVYSRFHDRPKYYMVQFLVQDCEQDFLNSHAYKDLIPEFTRTIHIDLSPDNASRNTQTPDHS
jgi:hypothetical protein